MILMIIYASRTKQMTVVEYIGGGGKGGREVASWGRCGMGEISENLDLK